MNYGELKQAVALQTHRTTSQYAALIPDFIRQGEGMIRRELTAYSLAAVLDDTFRSAPGSPVYLLPGPLAQIRVLIYNDARNGRALQKTEPAGLTTTDIQSPPQVYAQYDPNTIEIRGNPATGATFNLLYFGLPAPLVNDADTNELLTDHETLYLAASKFFLYEYSQDLELANAQLDLFNGVISSLNEFYDRMIGGQRVEQNYNFGFRSSY